MRVPDYKHYSAKCMEQKEKKVNLFDTRPLKQVYTYKTLIKSLASCSFFFGGTGSHRFLSCIRDIYYDSITKYCNKKKSGVFLVILFMVFQLCWELE